MGVWCRKEDNVIWCTRSETTGKVLFGTCGVQLWNYHNFYEEGKVVPLFLNCSKNQRWKEKFLNNDWLAIN
jgi:hypothetical protein